MHYLSLVIKDKFWTITFYSESSSFSSRHIDRRTTPLLIFKDLVIFLVIFGEDSPDLGFDNFRFLEVDLFLLSTILGFSVFLVVYSDYLGSILISICSNLSLIFGDFKKHNN